MCTPSQVKTFLGEDLLVYLHKPNQAGLTKQAQHSLPLLPTQKGVTPRRWGSFTNLYSLKQQSLLQSAFSVGPWNHVREHKKTNFILLTLTTLTTNNCFLALTETWIRSHNTATPAAFSTNNFIITVSFLAFGAALLISNLYTFSPPILSHIVFLSEASCNSGDSFSEGRWGWYLPINRVILLDWHWNWHTGVIYTQACIPCLSWRIPTSTETTPA